jgi:hypothetical protein
MRLLNSLSPLSQQQLGNLLHTPTLVAPQATQPLCLWPASTLLTMQSPLKLHAPSWCEKQAGTMVLPSTLAFTLTENREVLDTLTLCQRSSAGNRPGRCPFP